ncbi:MAG: hypothetical protein AAF579_05085 [Cyanobacteria bacterium P01_C01_bin.118]
MNRTRWSAISAMCLALISFYGSGVQAQSLRTQTETVQAINGQLPVTADAVIATDSTPSAQNFTVPSLWWQQQQQGDAIHPRLIESWRAYDTTVSPTNHVDVIVDGQIWPVLSYLEQYTFITQFGESAKSYNYQLRVFTGQRLVGLHVCNFFTANITEDEPPACRVELDYFGQGAIRGRPQR